MDTGAYLNSLFGLKGKVILITGAAGGIGNAISRGLAAAGGTVALCGRNLEKCRALMDEITASGGTASAHRLDVADLDSIHACVDEVAAQYGKIDVLFNIAGINKREGLLDVTPETYDRIMDTNLKGLFFVSQAVAREMYRQKSGNIVNIGSHNDTGMLGGCSVYGASKSGVVALTRSMAVEFAQYGIRCNAICPGNIITPMTTGTDPAVLDPDMIGAMAAHSNLKTPSCTAEDVANVILFFASDESRAITGQVIVTDFGAML